MNAGTPTPLGERLQSGPFPGELFHYTSSDALFAILTDRTLRATDINYLNDWNEFRHALDLARQHIGDSSFDTTLDSDRRRFRDRLEKRLSEVRPQVFVFSLSQEPDLLSQWRGYCPPGGGYSIGFNAERLDALAKASGFVLGPCIYDVQEQLDSVGKIVEHTITRYELLPHRSPEQRVDAAISYLTSELGHVGPFLKHPAFSEEKEWRLVSDASPMDPSEIEYRSSRRMLVPFVTVRVASNEVFTRVIVGPSEHQELAMRSLDGFLERHGFRNARAVGSAVSYRSL